VFDASSLINLERHRQLSILSGLGSRAVIPPRVAREVNTPRTDLARWLAQNRERVTAFLPDESALYYQFRTQTTPEIHDGEASAMAVALNRGWILVIDDIAARRKAESHGIPCLSATELLGQALM
jgi:predicted nucleic acid-binding protein